MIKYAKIINEKTKEVQVGLGTNDAYYIAHGFKKLEVEQCVWNGAWYLAGFCPEEPAEHIKERRVNKIKAELYKKDIKSARSVRAILAGTATESDKQYLATIEAEVAALREELKELQGE